MKNEENRSLDDFSEEKITELMSMDNNDLFSFLDGMDAKYDGKKMELLHEIIASEEKRKIKRIPIAYKCFLLIKSMKLNSSKIDALEIFKNFNYEVNKDTGQHPDFYVINIITSLELDDDKKQMIEKNELLNKGKELNGENVIPYFEGSEYGNRLIIKSMKETKSAIDCLKYVKDKRTIEDILKERKITTDEQRIAIINNTDEEAIISKFVGEIEDENKRIKCLPRIKNEFSRASVIKDLSSDKLKRQQMGGLKSVEAQLEVCCSLDSDNEKLEVLEELRPRIKEEGYLVSIIRSLKSDDKKIEQLKGISYEINRAEIIISFESDSLKLQHLSNIEDEFLKTHIAFSMEDVEKRRKVFEQLKTDRAKATVLASLYK